MLNQPEDPAISIVSGNLVSLGPVSRDMLSHFQRWLNDFPVQARIGMQTPGPITAETEEKWYESVSTDKSGVTFAVRDRATMSLVGTCGLHAIDFRNSSAHFGIFIGDPDFRGKGYGTETSALVLDYAFTILGLHSVNLTVAEFNLAGIRAYHKAGFRECGRWREQVRFNGRRWDTILMDCLAHDFTSPCIAKLLY